MFRRSHQYDYSDSGDSSDDSDVFGSNASDSSDADEQDASSAASSASSDDEWEKRVRYATTGELTDETRIRRALFQQDVAMGNVEGRRSGLLHQNASASSVRQANTVLPLTFSDPRAAPDPFRVDMTAGRERRGTFFRKGADGVARAVGEIWENAPPPPDKNYTAYARQGQHHLRRCTGYDPSRPDARKRESRAVVNPATVHSAQQDLRRREALAKECNMHDVYMNRTGVQAPAFLDTSRDNYADGGYNPCRHDAYLRSHLEPTWRNRQRVRGVVLSDAASTLPAGATGHAQRTRSRADAHLRTEHVLTGTAEQVVLLRQHDPVPVVA